MKVSAVVVTFNRKELLIECLEALRRQTRPLDALYIIDNASTDGTEELLRKEGYLKGTMENLHNGGMLKVNYIRLPKNTGGAGGFHEGVRRAYSDGYDWIWLMDDDAEPLPESLERLLDYESDGVAALANLKVGIDGMPQVIHRGFFDFNSFRWVVRPINPEMADECIKIDHASFVGILINSESIGKVGFPRQDFFLHYDDVEYCLRLRSTGDIILVTGSRILHKDSAWDNLEKKRFLWKEVSMVPYEKLWLRYYGLRNHTWLRKRNMNPLLFYIFLLRAIPLSLLGQIISMDNVIKRCRFILSAYYDGIRGNFNNEKPKKLLYE